MSDPHLASWRYSNDVWRSMRKMNLRYVKWVMKTVSAGRLPEGQLARLYDLGVPPEIVRQTLTSIRSLDGWSRAWVETAQGFLGNSRRETSAGNAVEAERARFNAAMCYHIAQILEVNDLKTRDNCRAWTSSLVKQSLPVVRPNARHMTVQWRDRKLPILFEAPDRVAEPFGIVVMFNGISQSKEETFLLAPRFLDAGYAVMAIDSPGTGEATSLGPLNATSADILDAVMDELRDEPTIDLSRLVLYGASFGGNEAIRIAQRISEVMAVIVVTPAVAPDSWIDYANVLMWQELQDAIGDREPHELAQSFDVYDAAERLKAPMLVFGAGRDLIVPPNESQKLAERVGERSTLVWYPDLSHCLYQASDQVIAESITWLDGILAARATGETDPAALNRAGKEALDQGHFAPREGAVEEWDEEDIEYARLIDPADDLDS